VPPTSVAPTTNFPTIKSDRTNCKFHLNWGLAEPKATIIVVFLALRSRPSDVIVMITGRQIRAARALLHWTQDMLAEKSLVALTALKRLESERDLNVHEGTRDQVRRALEAAGAVFIDSAQGWGVMVLNKPPSTRAPRASHSRN
jgi:hypothetical protein